MVAGAAYGRALVPAEVHQRALGVGSAWLDMERALAPRLALSAWTERAAGEEACVKYTTIGTDPKTRREVSVLSLGTMHFGTATDEATSFAILDRYVEAGGTFIDTSDSYAFWAGAQGGESEELLGRWRRSRGVGDLPGYEVLQYQYSYLRPRTDLPGLLSPDGMPGVLGGDLLSYLRAEPQLTMVAYAPLMRGGYVRQDKLDAAEFAEFDHPGTPARLAALREVAKDAGATVNQVVLAWMIGADVPVIPLVGASSVAQLDESLAAADLELTTEQRARLDAAR